MLYLIDNRYIRGFVFLFLIIFSCLGISISQAKQSTSEDSQTAFTDCKKQCTKSYVDCIKPFSVPRMSVNKGWIEQHTPRAFSKMGEEQSTLNKKSKEKNNSTEFIVKNRNNKIIIEENEYTYKKPIDNNEWLANCDKKLSDCEGECSRKYVHGK